MVGYIGYIDQMKRILIIYQGGHAGNLITRLLSLDPSTVFHRLDGSDINDTLNNRLLTYSFNNAANYSHWIEYHLAYTTKWRDNHINNIAQTIMVNSDHPSELYHDQHQLISADYIIYVNLSYSNFSNYWLMEFVTRLQTHTALRLQTLPPVFANARFALDSPSAVNQFKKKISVLTGKNVIELSLDAFLDSKTWQAEYIRISNILNIPVVDSAHILYSSWYNARVKLSLEQFNKLNIEQQTKYKEIRLEYEYNTPVIPYDEIDRKLREDSFAQYYNDIRGSDFPDCNTIADISNLPEWVLQEIDPKWKNILNAMHQIDK